VKKEPLKLMPLEEFGNLIERIARVPKDGGKPSNGATTKARPSAKKSPIEALKTFDRKVTSGALNGDASLRIGRIRR